MCSKSSLHKTAVLTLILILLMSNFSMASIVPTTAKTTIAVADLTTNVSTSSDLKAAIASAKAGDHIVLADGQYTLDTVRAQGTTANPIVIEAAHRGMAVISNGNVKLDGCANVVLSGLKFTVGETLFIENSTNCRLTRNTFNLTENGDELHWIKPLETSSHIRIDHNVFDGKTAKGNYISFAGEKGISQYALIDHNAFKNIKDQGENGTETIRMGLGAIATSKGYGTIEYNLFENCDGDAEVISSKCSDNIIRYNTIKGSTGSISLRQGARCQVYGNIILGDLKKVGKSTTGGIKVYGQDHSIHDNFIEKCTGKDGRAALVIDSGDADLVSTDDSLHCRVYRAKVYNNILYNNLHGFQVGGAKYGTFSPINCVFINNTVIQDGNKCFDIYGEVNSTWQGNTAWPTGSAVVGAAKGIVIRNPKIDVVGYEKKALTSAQVGPFAP